MGLTVLIIGTYDEEGQADAMNAAWGGLYESNMVELCLSAGHRTTKNILAKKAFTVSFADAAHVEASTSRQAIMLRVTDRWRRLTERAE